MGRVIVILAFAVATAATGSTAWNLLEHAANDGTIAAWAVFVHRVLKLGVIAAFTYFVAVRDAPRSKARSPLAIGACVVAIVAIVFVPSPKQGASAAVVVAGDVVAIAFALWLLASVLALGRCFGILPEARGLVTRGPYRYVRHPVYLGEIGMCVGLAIASPTAVGVAAVGAVTAAQFARMRFEEHALTAAFPSYREYAARTPRFVPRLRRSNSRAAHVSASVG